MEAVVLGVRDYGEGHRLVELLTREEGLVRGFAPGAARSRRRFGGALEPMSLLEVQLQRRPGRDLVDMKEATVLRAWHHLRESLEAIALGGYVVDLARNLVREAQPHPETFALVVAALERLDAGTFGAWTRAAFDLGVLVAFGTEPELGGCVRCGEASTGDEARFSPEAGGLLCPRCAPKWGPADVVLPRRAIRALVSLAEAGATPEILDRAGHLPEDAEASAAAVGALEGFVQAQIGKRLASLDFLDGVSTWPSTKS